MFETWWNRHNVKQKNQRDDALDVVSSTFNGGLSETLNKLVAIHLEDTYHLVGVAQPSDPLT